MTTAKPPAFKPHQFTVHLLPEGADPAILDDPATDVLAVEYDTHRVTVLWADQVRAEAAGSTGKGAALAALWVWAAMARTGRTRDKYPVFSRRVLDITPDDDNPTDDDTDEGEAGPT